MTVRKPVVSIAVFAASLAVAGPGQPPRVGAAQVAARSLGACHFYDPRQPDSTFNAVSPIGALVLYVQIQQRAQLEDRAVDEATVRFVRPPQHGRIRTTDGVDHFVPEPGFTGSDSYVAEVRMQGQTFKVEGQIKPSSDVMTDFDVLCRRHGLPGVAWKR